MTTNTPSALRMIFLFLIHPAILHRDPEIILIVLFQVFYAHIIGLGVFSLSDLHHPFQKIAVQAAKRLLKPVFKGLFPQEQKQKRDDHNSRGGNNHDFLFHFRPSFASP